MLHEPAVVELKGIGKPLGLIVGAQGLGSVIDGKEVGEPAEASPVAVLQARIELVDLAVGTAVVLAVAADTDLIHHFGLDLRPLLSLMVFLIDAHQGADSGVDAAPVLDVQRTGIIVQDAGPDQVGALGVLMVIAFKGDVAGLGDAQQVIGGGVVGVVLAEVLVVGPVPHVDGPL